MSFFNFALLLSSASSSPRSAASVFCSSRILHLFELRQVAQTCVEDLLGLLIREPEALHQHRLRLILAADDADHLIEVQERDGEAVENVQPARHFLQTMLQAPGDGRGAELKPLAQHLLQAHQRAGVRRAR